MKRYLILIVTFMVLILGVIGGCNQKPLQVYELSPKNALPPKIIEDDWDSGASRYNEYLLPFNLKVGDRVEGEVSVTPNQSGSVVVGEVRDPYGNRIVETWTISSRGGFVQNHGFPWRFAFIAPTDGEYNIRVYVTGGISTGEPSAHLKIVVYTND